MFELLIQDSLEIFYYLKYTVNWYQSHFLLNYCWSFLILTNKLKKFTKYNLLYIDIRFQIFFWLMFKFHQLTLCCKFCKKLLKYPYNGIIFHAKSQSFNNSLIIIIKEFIKENFSCAKNLIIYNLIKFKSNFKNWII